MFKKVSILLIGIIIGALSFGATFIFAQGPIKLIVNGKEIKSDVPPQVINGRKMVPARFLAEALGATVTWDESKNAVIVTSQSQKPANNNSNSIDLTSLEYAGTDSDQLYIDKWGDTGWYWLPEKFKVAGKVYDRGIGFALGTTQDAYIAYDTESKYNRLTGYFGIADASDNEPDLNTTLIVYGDGQILYQSPAVSRGDVPIYVDVDISNVNQLKLVFDTI